MKYFHHFVVISFLLIFSTSAAYAQFSILPYAKPEADCKSLLDAYETDRKIPTVAEISEVKRQKANQKSLDAQKALKDGEEALLDAKATLRSYGENLVGATERAAKVVELEEKKDKLKKALLDAKAERDKAAKEEEEKKRDDNSRTGENRDNLLGCAIKTGRISLAMIPYFITYITNFLLSLSGLVSVLFVVIGGYQYIYGGLGESKDKAKKTIVHALTGLAIAILAWSIVNVIMNAITG